LAKIAVCLEVNGSFVDCLILKGRILEKIGQHKEAVLTFKKAIRLSWFEGVDFLNAIEPGCFLETVFCFFKRSFIRKAFRGFFILTCIFLFIGLLTNDIFWFICFSCFSFWLFFVSFTVKKEISHRLSFLTKSVGFSWADQFEIAKLLPRISADMILWGSVWALLMAGFMRQFVANGSGFSFDIKFLICIGVLICFLFIGWLAYLFFRNSKKV
jgi:hypothetical protein